MPCERRDGDTGHVANQDRRAIAFAPEHDPLDVLHTLQEGDAADEPLLAIVDDVAAAGCFVVAFDAAEDVIERKAVAGEPVGIGADFKRLVKAAVGVDLGDAFDLPQLGRDLPFEQRP